MSASFSFFMSASFSVFLLTSFPFFFLLASFWFNFWHVHLFILEKKNIKTDQLFCFSIFPFFVKSCLLTLKINYSLFSYKDLACPRILFPVNEKVSPDRRSLSKNLAFSVGLLQESLNKEMIVWFLSLEVILASFLLSLEMRAFFLPYPIFLVADPLSTFWWTILWMVVNGISKFLSFHFFLMILKLWPSPWREITLLFLESDDCWLPLAGAIMPKINRLNLALSNYI